MSRTTVKTGLSVALAATTLLGLAACSDPGASAASGASPTASSSSGVKPFNLSPQQDRVKAPPSTRPLPPSSRTPSKRTAS